MSKLLGPHCDPKREVFLHQPGSICRSEVPVSVGSPQPCRAGCTGSGQRGKGELRSWAIPSCAELCAQRRMRKREHRQWQRLCYLLGSVG